MTKHEDKHLRANATAIENEIVWFRELLDRRFHAHAAGHYTEHDLIETIPPPQLGRTPYGAVIREFKLSAAERLILLLAFLPQIRPDALDPFLIRNEALQRRFTEFGGIAGAQTGFLPTAETALFLLAGRDTHLRLHYLSLLSADHVFFRRQILQFEQPPAADPSQAALLRVSPEYFERLTTGRPWTPPFGPDFPAQRITTPASWEDLVLDAATMREVQDIVRWIKNRDFLLDEWHLRDRIRPGFRSLFYGPPGTGKTLTATLLGKATNLPVYRIDLSKIVSKYIGETEKNLALVFDHAEHADWILFFDEADSLFGRRTESRTSNDRAANQQISYLLQRVEDFPGVVILASNLRSQIDEAFYRRFQSTIHFDVPGFEHRLQLWSNNFSDKPYKLAPDVELARLARDYELTGGNIVNVLRYACLQAVEREPREIRNGDILFAIRAERHKEGKSMQS